MYKCRFVYTLLCLNPGLVSCSEIAALSDEYSDLLVPDEGCEYDQVVEINLDEVCPVWYF